MQTCILFWYCIIYYLKGISVEGDILELDDDDFDASDPETSDDDDEGYALYYWSFLYQNVRWQKLYLLISLLAPGDNTDQVKFYS